MVRHTEDFCLEDGVYPKKMMYEGNKVYGLGSNGSLYLWDSRVSLSFKEEAIGTERFNDLHMGK